MAGPKVTIWARIYLMAGPRITIRGRIYLMAGPRITIWGPIFGGPFTFVVQSTRL